MLPLTPPTAPPVDAHMHVHAPSTTAYFGTFGALMVLTVVTVIASEVDLGRFNIAVALAIAFTKATMVVWFFMHVRFATRLVQLSVCAALVWLVILFTFTVSDVATRNWLPTGKF